MGAAITVFVLAAPATYRSVMQHGDLRRVAPSLRASFAAVFYFRRSLKLAASRE